MRKLAVTLAIGRHKDGGVQSRSLLSSLALWFFICAIACDTANLDDLLSPAIVLHGDDEVVLAGLNLPDAGLVSHGTDQRQTAGVPDVRQYSSVHHPFVRVIIDQDSPSLAANDLQISSKTFRFLKDSPPCSADVLPSTGLLHLLFHSLLI